MMVDNNNDDNNDRIHLVTGLLFHACDATEFSLGSVTQVSSGYLSWIWLDLVEWVRIQFHHKQTNKQWFMKFTIHWNKQQWLLLWVTVTADRFIVWNLNDAALISILWLVLWVTEIVWIHLPNKVSYYMNQPCLLLVFDEVYIYSFDCHPNLLLLLLS